MDALTGLLRGPRAQGTFLLRSVMSPPWSIRIQDEAPLTVVAMVRGQAWIVADDPGAAPQTLHPGDVAVLRGPDRYIVADEPATEPQIVIHPGQRCTTPDGESLAEAMDLGVRTWGNSPLGAAMMLTGTYQGAGEISRRLLGALPFLIVLRADEWDCPVISVLRAWFAREGVKAPAWYRAHTDPIIGRALRMLHNDPAHPWTVAGLAAEVGVARATLARRFTELVGEPPLSY